MTKPRSAKLAEALSADNLGRVIQWLDSAWAEELATPPRLDADQTVLAKDKFCNWVSDFALAWSEAITKREATPEFSEGVVHMTGHRLLGALMKEHWCRTDQLKPQLVVAWLWSCGRSTSTSPTAIKDTGEAVSLTPTQLKHYLSLAEGARARIDCLSREPWSQIPTTRVVTAPTRDRFDHTLPPRPERLYGRATDLAELKHRLGVASTSGVEALRAQVLTALRGIGGMGKSSVAAELAWDSDVRRVFPDGVIWCALGQEPGVEAELGHLGRMLGSDSVAREDLRMKQVRAIASLFGEQRVLLVLDDVWELEHAAPFRAALGRRCSLLLATRVDDLATQLALTRDAIYHLPPLTPGEALKMLSHFAPSVVQGDRDGCAKLLDQLGHLPLAIRVAGPMLEDEQRLGWSVGDVMKALHEGPALIGSRAPLEYLDFERHHLPTVGAVLRRSTDRLSATTRARFASLASFVPKPYEFSTEDVAARWKLVDPRATLRELVHHGLVEPAGAGRFQIHPVLWALARSLLEQAS